MVKFANIVAGYYSLKEQRKKSYEELLKKTYLLKKELLKEIEK